MPFAFPQDSGSKAGAIKVNTDGNSFHIPVVQYQSDGITPVDATNPLLIKLAQTGIVLPVEISMADKEQVLLSTTVLAANAVYISPTIDCIATKRICGQISADQAGTLYLQQSDDSATWYTVSTTAIAIATSVVISAVTYYSVTQIDINVTSRYARLVYVNGATAQVRFNISGYKSVL